MPSAEKCEEQRHHDLGDMELARDRGDVQRAGPADATSAKSRGS
jgi:hypothetical protein